MRSDAVAMAKAFSMPSADSRIGISQIGRVMPARFAIELMAPTTSDTCCRSLDLGNEDQVGRLRNDLLQVCQAQRQLIDADHALGCAEIHRPQRIAHQQPRHIFLGVVHRIFEVENDCVRRVQSGVDEVLGLVARQVEPRAAQAITGRRRRQRHGFRQRGLALAKSGTAHRCFNSRGNDEWQRAFVHDLDEGVLDAECSQNLTHLSADRLAVVQLDARLQFDLDAATGALFEADVQVGAHVAAGASGLAAFCASFCR